MKRQLILLAVLFLFYEIGYAQSTVVTITSGKVEGTYTNSIFTYKGVPYAKAARFMPPQKPDDWGGIRKFIEYGHICPQDNLPQDNDFIPANTFAVQGEDCQNLNVWTPGINDGKKRPVMVWLHGGGFQTGSSIEQKVYDGANLSRKGDVVVVSINHRLNVLGFMDLSAYGNEFKYSGNVGTMDMVAALHWIKDNIKVFGGDPDNITIFGQSGGGAKVLVLMTAPAARGLFSKAIVESGAVEACGMTLVTSEVGKRVAQLTLQNLGLKGNDVGKLQTIPYGELIQASTKAMAQTAKEQGSIDSWGNPGLLWTPIMDGDYVPMQPVVDSITFYAKDIPLLIGSNMTEWTTMSMLSQISEYENHNRNTWSKEETEAKLRERFGNNTDAVVKAFKKAYPGRNIADVLYVETMLRLPALKTARLKADQHGAPVYNYMFTWDTPLYGGFAMSYHCAELPFVFNNISMSKAASGGGRVSHRLADQISGAWIAFARTGNPNHKGLPKWPVFTRSKGTTMIFDSKSEVRINYDYELMSLLRPDYKF